MNLDEQRWAFFARTECERCGGELRSRGMSWFTFQTICGACLEKERTLRRQLIERGEDPDAYEGCGYLPTLERENGTKAKQSAGQENGPGGEAIGRGAGGKG